jgi:D-alanine-D-alanine ligase
VSDLGVAVLAGGLSHERDVSLRSGRRIAAALRETGAGVAEWDTDAALVGRMRGERPDAVVIALHGGEGENGAVQSVLEVLGVPFVGTDPRACRRAHDKPTAKAELVRAGLTTPEWVALPHATFRELGATAVLEALVGHLGLPLMLKPDQGGSALGTQVVRRAEDLPAAMVGALAYSETVLVERFVAGTEVAVSVIETPGQDGGTQLVALPAVEVEPEGGVYDYTARYTAGHTQFFVPARLDDARAAAVAEAAVAAHTALGLRDLSRVDAIVDDAGAVQLLEVNTAPGMTETSLLPMAVEAAGLSFGQLLRTMLDTAAARA